MTEPGTTNGPLLFPLRQPSVPFAGSRRTPSYQPLSHSISPYHLITLEQETRARRALYELRASNALLSSRRSGHPSLSLDRSPPTFLLPLTMTLAAETSSLLEHLIDSGDCVCVLPTYCSTDALLRISYSVLHFPGIQRAVLSLLSLVHDVRCSGALLMRPNVSLVLMSSRQPFASAVLRRFLNSQVSPDSEV